MVVPTSELSPALLAANEQLLTRRAELETRVENGPAPPWHQSETQPPAPVTSADAKVARLPAHLGWGSDAVTRHLRQVQARKHKQAVAAQPFPTPPIPQPTSTDVNGQKLAGSQPHHHHYQSDHIAVIPDLAFGMLKKGLASQGRLWYLLRHLDSTGRGWHEQSKVRHTLTKTAYRFCGRRQLSNLLKEGEGIFWRFNRSRIWLLCPGRVAAKLEVGHANYRPVAVPLRAFLGKVGLVRAHLYATYHSARAKDHDLGMPVARETIEQITGVDPHSQRSYEKQLHLDVRHNLAVGEEIIENEQGQALAQERAWRHGNALFTLTDYKGQQGPKGRKYHAWQLPNSYGAIHAAENRSKRRRLNRQLIDLQKKGAGNDRVGRRYFANGKQLERARGELWVDQYVRAYQSKIRPSATGRFSSGATWSVFSEGIL